MEVKVIGCSTTWTDKPVSCYCINNKIIVDSGEGTLKYYKQNNVNFLDVNNIFITHLHTDHFAGLGAYISQVLVYEDESKKYRLSIYGPKGIKKALNILAQNFACPTINKKVEDYINVVEISSKEQIIEVENFKIKPFILNHGGLINIGYVFEDSSSAVGFSGDCTYDENVKEFVANTKVAFLDCCSEKTTPSHMGADKFKYLQQCFPNKRLIATHSTDEFILKAKEYDIETTYSGKKYNF